MNNIADLFKAVRQFPGTANKVTCLKGNRSPLLDAVITAAMDPSVTYGITSKEITAPAAGSEEGEWFGGFKRLLDELAARRLTGNDALRSVEAELARWDADTQELMKQILDRDLKLGVSWKTYRIEVMGLNDQFEVALAQHLEKVSGVNPVDGTWFASRKCDGCRCVAIVSDEGVEFRSRQNKEFLVLENLKPAVQRFCAGLKGTWVLDGELCKVDANGDEDFGAMMKEIRRKDYSVEDCCYQLFDILTYDEFCAGKSKNKLDDRLCSLACLNTEYEKLPHERCWVRPLKQERLMSQDDFDRWAGYVEAGNWEGFMLRKDTYYASGRTKDLLKVKKFFDDEYVVEGVECGEMTTSLPGQGLVKYEGVTNLKINHKGNRVDVGAGLTREQRIAWMKDPSLIIGKVITVKYFEETTNKAGAHSLRFPTLKHVYDGKRDV